MTITSYMDDPDTKVTLWDILSVNNWQIGKMECKLWFSISLSTWLNFRNYFWDILYYQGSVLVCSDIYDQTERNAILGFLFQWREHDHGNSYKENI